MGCRTISSNNPSYNELTYSLLSLTLNYSLKTHVASPRSNIPFIIVCGYAQLNFFNRQHLRPPVCRLANAVEVERHLPVETITPTNFLAAARREKEGGNCYWARLASWRLTCRLVAPTPIALGIFIWLMRRKKITAATDAYGHRRDRGLDPSNNVNAA